MKTLQKIHNKTIDVLRTVGMKINEKTKYYWATH